MEEYFPYQTPVSGPSFIGRKDSCDELRQCIDNGGNALISDIPKSGKSSLVRQALFAPASSKTQLPVLQPMSDTLSEKPVSCFIDLVSVTSSSEFILRIAESLMRSMLSSPIEYSSAVQDFLQGGHFVFDAQLFSDSEQLLSLSENYDHKDMLLALSLGENIAKQSGRKLIVILDNFHIASRLDDCNSLLRAMSAVMTNSMYCHWVIVGSKVNEMASMFNHSPLFSSCLKQIRLSPIPARPIISYITSTFDRKGKVIVADVVQMAIRITGGTMWYLNHLMSICDTLTRGYVTQTVLMQATQNLLFIHDVRFRCLMDSLTFHQMSFLKAIVDGVTQFTGKKIIADYGLNSSANIVRVRESLLKKEIILVKSDGSLAIQDPLMDYWLKHSFFRK